MACASQTIDSWHRVSQFFGILHSAGLGQFAAIQSMAPSVGVEVAPINVRDADEMERAVTEFARLSNGALIVAGSGAAIHHRNPIIALAVWHKLPAAYYERVFAVNGGLISYGLYGLEEFHRAAGYFDRILKKNLPICRCKHRPSMSWSGDHSVR